MRSILLILIAVSLAGCATVRSQSKVDVLQIDAKGTLHLNGKLVPIADLPDAFTHDAIVIEADRASSHENVVAVLNAARDAGIMNVSLKTRYKEK